MSVPASPVSGFSHVQLLVSDVAASEQWYTTVLGMERLAAADDASYVALRHRPGKFVLVLSHDVTGASVRQGRLDHLAFAVPGGTALEEWARRLHALGIEHAGVVDEMGKPSLMLTDPDGTPVELVAPPGS
jgi:glyoxalase family protein